MRSCESQGGVGCTSVRTVRERWCGASIARIDSIGPSCVGRLGNRNADLLWAHSTQAGVLESCVILGTAGIVCTKAMLMLVDCKNLLVARGVRANTASPVSPTRSSLHRDDAQTEETIEMVRMDTGTEPLIESDGEGREKDSSVEESLDYGDIAIAAAGIRGWWVSQASIVMSQVRFVGDGCAPRCIATRSVLSDDGLGGREELPCLRVGTRVCVGVPMCCCGPTSCSGLDGARSAVRCVSWCGGSRCELMRACVLAAGWILLCVPHLHHAQCELVDSSSISERGAPHVNGAPSPSGEHPRHVPSWAVLTPGRCSQRLRILRRLLVRLRQGDPRAPGTPTSPVSPLRSLFSPHHHHHHHHPTRQHYYRPPPPVYTHEEHGCD